MSRACGETIGPRIRTCRFVDASGRCSGSNRPDQHNGSCPFMPQSRTRSTSNAISFPAIRSALLEAKRFRIGGRRLRPEQEPSPSTLVRSEPSSRDNPTGAAHGFQADHGGCEKLAAPARTKSVAQDSLRSNIPRRNRSREPRNVRRLIHAVAQIPA